MESFRPDTETGNKRVGSESYIDIDSGNQMIVHGLSGEHYEKLDLAVLPGANIVIIGDNAVARRELVNDLANAKTLEGDVVRLPKDARIEFVSPTITNVGHPETSLRDFFLSARGVEGVEDRLAELWMKASDSPEALREAGKLQEIFENAGGWNIDDDIDALIKGLRIASNIHDNITLETKLGDMSSGQISKALIGWALFSRSGIIVMDDPSVHLDTQSKEWLADYIKGSPQATITATSDMQFATSIADRVVEILDTGQVLNIGLGIETYNVERNKMLAFWIDEATRRKKEIADLEVHIRDFLSPAGKRTDSMAQVLRATRSRLYRMQEEYDAMPGKRLIENQGSQLKPQYFEAKTRSGADVVAISDLSIMYDSSDGDSTIIEIPKLDLYSGERLAVLGKNGSGKSTILRVLAGQTDGMYLEGGLKMGSSIDVAYSSPYTDFSDHTPTTLRSLVATKTSDPMGILSYWGFDKTSDYDLTLADLRYKDEISRAQFALMMAQGPNFMILDEPTSYLTPKYQERLVKALQSYNGTLLVASHDTDFLSKIRLEGKVQMPSGLKRVYQ